MFFGMCFASLQINDRHCTKPTKCEGNRHNTKIITNTIKGTEETWTKWTKLQFEQQHSLCTSRVGAQKSATMDPVAVQLSSLRQKQKAGKQDTVLYIHIQSPRHPNWPWSHASIDPLTSGFTMSAVSLWVVLSPPSTFGLCEHRTSGGSGGCSSAAPLTWWNMMRQRWDKLDEDGGAWRCVDPPTPILFKTCLCGSHRDVDCLMLWKLTREGDVGIDIAWVIRARMECCSCHRWKRFLTAERTCHTGGQTGRRQSQPISGHASKKMFG